MLKCHLPGLPPPVVMVDDAVIIGLHDRTKSLQHKISSMQREAQYQVGHAAGCPYCDYYHHAAEC
jgi:hypothetical protein